MKRKPKWIVICVIISIIIAAAVLYYNSHFLYILGENFGVNCEKIEVGTANPDHITQFTLDELNANEKVQFDQSMMLINTEFTLESDFVPAVSQYKDTEVQMNDCMHEAYDQLSAAVTKDTGKKLLVISDYRTQEEQEDKYEDDASTATKPGASEHQSGLALDVCVQYHAGYGFIKTDAGQFVNSNSWKYGFIIRYPSYGKNETGIKYEPWHIRYVGEPHAKIIYNNHLTLEEYITSLEDGVWYEVDEYLISRQKLSDKNTLSLPAKYSGVVISPDNTGSYIITVTK